MLLCMPEFLSYPKGMEFMKKSFVRVLTLLVCVLCFAGCKAQEVEPPALTFTKAQQAEPIKQLVIADGVGTLEDVGHVLTSRGQFCMTDAYMNGDPRRDGELYYYVAPEAFVTLRKREIVVGVLLYDSVPYGAVIADDGTEMLYTLDDTLASQTWKAFYNAVLKAEK